MSYTCNQDNEDNKIDNKMAAFYKDPTKPVRYHRDNDHVFKEAYQKLSSGAKNVEYKLTHTDEYYRDNNALKIPHINHVVYFAKDVNFVFKQKHVDAIKNTATNLNDVDGNFKHYFWTNHKEIVPQEIIDIPGLEVRTIDEFDSHSLYNSLKGLLYHGDTGLTGYYAGASDITRLLVVEKYGGIYHDADYMILEKNIEKLMDFTKSFSYLNGLEIPDTYNLGNAFFAASPGNPVIKENLKLMSENIKNTRANHEYPADVFVKMVRETGPICTSEAFYNEAQRNPDNDYLVPDYSFFYAQDICIKIYKGMEANIPTSDCEEQLYHEIGDNAIGCDPFAGTWGEHLVRFELVDVSDASVLKLVWGE